MSGRVLVAEVGNVLRGDDGFGVAVARRLAAEDRLPSVIDLIETGIGGLSIVHQLMDGYETLIVVDSVDRGAAPGTVFVLEPSVPNPHALSAGDWQSTFSNLHLAEPSRVFVLAKALDVLPKRTLLVGCQPRDCDELSEGLSPPVQAAVAVAARTIHELIEAMPNRAGGGETADVPGRSS